MSKVTASRWADVLAKIETVFMPDITDHLAAIDASATSDELAPVYKAALEACLGNQALQAKVIAAKKARVERAKQEKSA